VHGRAIDDGEVVWIECRECGVTVTAWPREDCPLMLLVHAERSPRPANGPER
jgi:hypothetical protein